MKIHRGGEMVGFWMREKSGKNPDGKHHLRHMGWPPGARAVAEILQAEVLCAEEGFCSVGLGSIGGNFRGIWEG